MRTSPSIITRAPGSGAQSVHRAAGSWTRSAPQHRTAPSAGAWRRAGTELLGEPTLSRSRGSPPPSLPAAAERCTRTALSPLHDTGCCKSALRRKEVLMERNPLRSRGGRVLVYPRDTLSVWNPARSHSPAWQSCLAQEHFCSCCVQGLVRSALSLSPCLSEELNPQPFC